MIRAVELHYQLFRNTQFEKKGYKAKRGSSIFFYNPSPELSLTMAQSPLRALVNILSNAVDGIEGVYEKNGATFPNLDAPYTPSPLEHDPQVMGLTAVLLGAAFQLMMTVGTPIENITTTYTCQMYMTASLRYVVETSIADVLKEGDPKVRFYLHSRSAYSS